MATDVALEGLPPFLPLEDEDEDEGQQPPGAAAGERRKIWGFVVLSAALSFLLTVALWVAWYCAEGPQEQQSFSSPFGWMTAFAGALIFSFTEIPVKLPDSQAVGAVLFNAYGAFGCALVNALAFPALWALGLPFRLQLHGCFAALDILLVQFFARHAVWRIGIGAAPACWASVGILTSFLWGTLAFGDRPWHLPLTVTGLALLIVGVAFVSLAVFLSRRGAASAPSEPQKAAASYEVPLGLGFALLTGLCDGSLVTFFMHAQAGSDSGRSLEGMLQYFASLGGGSLALNAAAAALYLTAGPGRKLSWPDLRLWQCGVPAMLSGAVWAMANSCGILSAYHMGMALAFPLTQTCLVFGGLWALVVFRELRTPLASAVFLLAMLLAVAGAMLLSLFGRATQPW